MRKKMIAVMAAVCLLCASGCEPHDTIIFVISDEPTPVCSLGQSDDFPAPQDTLETEIAYDADTQD